MKSVLVNSPSSHVLKFSVIYVFPPRSITLHADGSRPPSHHITPKLRVCDKIPLLPLHVASFWSFIQTHQPGHITKGSCLSLMFPQGISVQEEDVEGWLVNLFLISTGCTSNAAYGAGWFYIGHSSWSSCSEADVDALTSTCRSPCRCPGTPRLLRDFAAKPQVSATCMTLASFGGALAVLPMQGNDGNKLGLPAWSKPTVFLLVFIRSNESKTVMRQLQRLCACDGWAGHV